MKRVALRLLLAAVLACGVFVDDALPFGFMSGGSAGPQGPEGPPGPPGADGTTGAPGAPGVDANRPLNACGIAWTGSGYVFRVAACEYTIAGTTYTAPETEVTFAAADETFNRIDLVAVNVAGEVVVLEGTPAATPATPEVDPSTQLQIGFVTIDAQSTEPANVTIETIFTEGGAESWTESEVGTTIDVASSSNCRTGSVCVEGTSVPNNDYFEFLDPSGLFDLSAYDTMVCHLRLKAGWTGPRGLSVEWRSSATHSAAVLLRSGQLGIDASNTTTYQQIVIPTASFAVTPGVQVDRVRFTRVGGSTLGFYVDDCSLQGGVQQTIVGTASMQYRGTWAATANYLANHVVKHDGSTYIALANNTDVTPGTSETTWTTIGGSAGGGGGKPFKDWTTNQCFPQGTATFDFQNNHPVIRLDQTNDECFYCEGFLESTYAGGGLTVDVVLTAAATSGAVGILTAFEAHPNNFDIDADSFGTEKSSSTTVPGTQGFKLYVSHAHTDSEIDSLAAGQAFRVRVCRDGNGSTVTDSLANDALVTNVVVREP